MAAADLGAAEWERSKITNQDLNLLKKLGINKKPKAVCFPSEKATQPLQWGIGTRVQPLQARKNPFGIMLATRTQLLVDESEVKDLDRLIRKISSLKKKDSIPSTYRVTPYSAANALPKDHPNLVSLPPLPEGGEVEERAVISDDNEDAPSFANEPAESRKSAGSGEKEDVSEATASAQSPPPAVSPRNKRKRDDAKIPAPPRPKKLSLLTRRQVMIHTSRLSSVLIMKKKYQLLMWLLERPMIKELLRIGAQFVGYRDYASKTEEKLAEANERADMLAQKLEQCEEARKKAESDAVEARQEADKAKADAAGVEDLRKRLHDAETSLSEHITAQSAREAAITKRIRTQNRRFVNRTSQEFELENPDNDSLLDAVSFLEFHGTEAREGMDEARAGLSKLFPYFFPKKEEPATFLGLAKCFNPPEDLGLKMRHENMKVAVESTVALVADSQQTIDQSWRHGADRANKVAIIDQGGKAEHEENPGLSRDQAIFDSQLVKAGGLIECLSLFYFLLSLFLLLLSPF
ncbi:hypothetical protein QYE76_033556 [Lolium multiflorum]|uniref:Uncharacterized protein n=1 Tax=Lolium multiflorum TaxID=4521 RepID=A0AAD8QZB6_LOLMU|nr:hypothetical protein QYE76_033556 [Lolium multiflorum]